MYSLIAAIASLRIWKWRWIGHSVFELLQDDARGPPSGSHDLLDGGQVWNYSRSHTATISDSAFDRKTA